MTTLGQFLYRGWRECHRCGSLIQKSSVICTFCERTRAGIGYISMRGRLLTVLKGLNDRGVEI